MCARGSREPQGPGTAPPHSRFLPPPSVPSPAPQPPTADRLSSASSTHSSLEPEAVTVTNRVPRRKG